MTMAHSFGDVVLVPFPFTDQSGAKKRPAVIVSRSGYHAARRDLIIMAITSQVRHPLGFGEALVADWQVAGLIKPSVLKSRAHNHRSGARRAHHGRVVRRRSALFARGHRAGYRLSQTHEGPQQAALLSSAATRAAGGGGFLLLLLTIAVSPAPTFTTMQIQFEPGPFDSV